MRLLLTNGYPFPCPEGFDSEAEGYDSRDYSFELLGVIQFEWKYTLTIEFKDYDHFQRAQARTGWAPWGRDDLILEATTSRDDGYDQPAIVVGGKAYCGFILENDA